jgi:prepilin-type processing-associated H-X9-DG protein
MMVGGGSIGAYYTKGETISLGDETYLIAYRPKQMTITMELLNRSDPPQPEKLTPDSVLHLSILNIKAVGSITDIQPFDMKTEIKESLIAAGEDVEELDEEEMIESLSEVDQSVYNLKQLSIGLIMYADDNGTLPDMNNSVAVQVALKPYVRNEKVFSVPGKSVSYVPNAILTDHKIAHIAFPSKMAVFYEPEIDENGMRAVAFLDGHVTCVSESDWETIKKDSKIK